MNYSKEDLNNIFTLYSNVGFSSKHPELYPELNDISEILNIIFHRTAFFSPYIDDDTSYQSISYIINLFKSIDKEDLKLIDHHLIDCFTYPYNSYINIFINKLNAIFRPKEFIDNATYVSYFSKSFSQLCAVQAARVDISQYHNLDILVKTYNNYLLDSPKKKEYYELLQLVVAYIYKNIDNFNEETILKVFDSLFENEYYLSKIKLNLAVFSGSVVMDSDILKWHTKKDINDAYNYVTDIINKVMNNNEHHKVKKVIR